MWRNNYRGFKWSYHFSVWCVLLTNVQLFWFPEMNYSTVNFRGLWGSGGLVGIVQVDPFKIEVLAKCAFFTARKNILKKKIFLFTLLSSLDFSCPVLFSSSGFFFSGPTFLFHTGFNRRNGEEKLQPQICHLGFVTYPQPNPRVSTFSPCTCVHSQPSPPNGSVSFCKSMLKLELFCLRFKQEHDNLN